MRLACHSPCSEHLLGVGRIIACRCFFGYAAIFHSVSILLFSPCAQGAERRDYTILLAHGGFLADVWGWRSVYFVACLFMLGCFLMIHRMLPVLSTSSQESYAGLMKSLLRLLSRYPYLRIASLRAALAYGSFFALWSCLAFRMKQEPFFATDDIIGALGLCGLAGASTVVFISGYVQKYGARFFSIAGGCVVLAAWILAFLGNDSYLWMIIAILLIDAGMQSIHLANQTSVVALDASAINRINTVYMTIYFLGGSAGTFVSGLSWQHYGWTGVVGVGIAFTVASLVVNCFKSQRHKGGH